MYNARQELVTSVKHPANQYCFLKAETKHEATDRFTHVKDHLHVCGLGEEGVGVYRHIVVQGWHHVCHNKHINHQINIKEM